MFGYESKAYEVVTWNVSSLLGFHERDDIGNCVTVFFSRLSYQG